MPTHQPTQFGNPQFRLRLPTPVTTDSLTIKLLDNHGAAYGKVPFALMGVQVYS